MLRMKFSMVQICSTALPCGYRQITSCVRSINMMFLHNVVPYVTKMSIKKGLLTICYLRQINNKGKNAKTYVPTKRTGQTEKHDFQLRKDS